VTIYDVATACGVAPSTVSRTFSRPGKVSARTAERIMRIARELGYHAPRPAPGHTAARSSLVALCVADVSNPFFLDIIQGVQNAAGQLGYTVLLIDARESLSGERDGVERVIPFVDGVILATSRMSETAIRMVAKQRPTVLLNRPMPDVPCLVTDNARGSRLAVEHLAALGHRSIGYVAGPDASWADGMRWRSVREAAGPLGVRVHKVGPFPPTLDGGAAAVEPLLQRPVTGVVTYNGLMAIGLISELATRGVRVPEDLSVVGFDDSFHAGLITPALTTIAVPQDVLGRLAMRMLLDQLARPDAPVPRPAMLASQLIVRGSTTAAGDGMPASAKRMTGL
jgi:LacI family transcriptional regulator